MAWLFPFPQSVTVRDRRRSELPVDWNVWQKKKKEKNRVRISYRRHGNGGKVLRFTWPWLNNVSNKWRLKKKKREDIINRGGKNIVQKVTKHGGDTDQTLEELASLKKNNK